MNITTTQLYADRDRVFADWGEEIILQQVAQAFDPGSHLITENATELSITAIVGARPTANVADGGGQLQSADRKLQIKSEDWTAITGDVTWRVLARGETYDIIEQVQSGDSLVLELHCRKVAGS